MQFGSNDRMDLSHPTQRNNSESLRDSIHQRYLSAIRNEASVLADAIMAQNPTPQRLIVEDYRAMQALLSSRNDGMLRRDTDMRLVTSSSRNTRLAELLLPPSPPRMDLTQRHLQQLDLQQLHSMVLASSSSGRSSTHRLPSPLDRALLQIPRIQDASLRMLQGQTAMRDIPQPTVSSASGVASIVNRCGKNAIPFSLPTCLACPIDAIKLSDHQHFLRQQIEVFQATNEDITTHIRGRIKTITLGQVGIRCRHCKNIPAARRQKGSTYFPSNKVGIYQAAQNMSTAHMQSGLCKEMPISVKLEFMRLQLQKGKCSPTGAGRPYWTKSATELGLVDTENFGIQFIRDLPPGVSVLPHEERMLSKIKH